MSAAIERSPEWHEERRSGLGGSDAAAACGLSRYKTAYQLWLEKTGRVEPEDLSDVERVVVGQEIEDTIARLYERRTGAKLHRVHRILRHAEHPWMLANIDRRVVGAESTKGVECKNVGEWAARGEDWGDEGTDEVPVEYLIQVQHYYAVTGWREFDLAALVGGNKLRVYSIPRDEDLIAELLRLEQAFISACVSDTPPEIRSVEDAQRAFPRSVARPIEASSEIAAQLQRFAALKAQQKDIEAEIDAVGGIVRAYMGECDTLTRAGKTLATWRTQSATRFDTAAFKAANPEAAAAFEKTSSFRVFRTAKESK